MSDTTLFLKRSAGHIRFYSPMVSRGFAYGLWQTTLFVVAGLTGWLTMIQNGIEVTLLHKQILWWGCLGTFIGSWFSYTDKTKAQFDQDKKTRDGTKLTTLG